MLSFSDREENVNKQNADSVVFFLICFSPDSKNLCDVEEALKCCQTFYRVLFVARTVATLDVNHEYFKSVVIRVNIDSYRTILR